MRLISTIEPSWPLRNIVPWEYQSKPVAKVGIAEPAIRESLYRSIPDCLAIRTSILKLLSGVKSITIAAIAAYYVDHRHRSLENSLNSLNSTAFLCLPMGRKKIGRRLMLSCQRCDQLHVKVTSPFT